MVGYRGPLFGKVNHSTPPFDNLVPDCSDDELEPEQRAAKRRRIEDIANGYRKGQEIYISCAVLKGVFDANCTNPWKRNRREEAAVPDSEHGSETLNDKVGQEKMSLELDLPERPGNTLISELKVAEIWDNAKSERPISRASTGYCNEWLHRQKTRSYSPTERSVEELRDPSERPPFTPSKSPKRQTTARKFVHVGNSSEVRNGILSRQKPSIDQFVSLEHQGNRSSTLEQEPLSTIEVPYSIEATLSSSALRGLPHTETHSQGNVGPLTKHHNEGVEASQRKVSSYSIQGHFEQALLACEHTSSFTPINPLSKGKFSSIHHAEQQISDQKFKAQGTRNLHHEVVRSAESAVGLSRKSTGNDVSKKPWRTDSLQSKGPVVDVCSSRHPLVASPANANGSPGFPYRRLSNGSRPTVPLPNPKKTAVRTKGKKQNNSAVIPSLQPMLGNSPTSDDAEPFHTAPDAPQDTKTPHSDSETEHQGVVQIVGPNANGVWACPVLSYLPGFGARGSVCNGRYITLRGLKQHITKGHKLRAVYDTTKHNSNPVQRRPKKISKSAARVRNRPAEVDGVPAQNSIASLPRLEMLATSAIEKDRQLSSAPRKLEETGQVPDVADDNQTLPNRSLSPALHHSATASRIEHVPSADVQIAVTDSHPESTSTIQHDTKKTKAKELTISGEGTNSQLESADSPGRDGEAQAADNSASSKDKTTIVESGPTIPDRQDSRAYSTFTFNPEASTQAALLQAQLAFQDTQVDNQDPDPGPDELNPHPIAHAAALTKSASKSLGAVTPFREFNDRHTAPRVPRSGFSIVPASTQDLAAAAANITFSTVKKSNPTKQISFADWPISKPSKGGFLKGAASFNDWSPSAELTPIPKNPFAGTETPIAPNDVWNENAHRQPGSRNANNSSSARHHPILSTGIAQISPVQMFSAQSSLAPGAISKGHSALTPQVRSFSARPIPMSSGFPISSMQSRTSSPSAPSDVPVPSFQEGQGQGMDAFESQDIERILDEADEFLGSWDVNAKAKPRKDESLMAF